MWELLWNFINRHVMSASLIIGTESIFGLPGGCIWYRIIIMNNTQGFVVSYAWLLLMQRGISAVVPQMWITQLPFVAAALELCELTGNNHGKQKSVLFLSFVEIQLQNFLQGLAHLAFFKTYIMIWIWFRQMELVKPQILVSLLYMYKKRILFIIWMNNFKFP